MTGPVEGRPADGPVDSPVPGAVDVVRVGPEHRADWDRLYAGYAAFYEVEQDDAMRDRVWGWLHDPQHEVDGFVALDPAGRPVGLAHVRRFARPLAAQVGLYLDDLYVDPAARGLGAGRTLLDAVAAHAREHGWTPVRWITAEDNARARALYDAMATSTEWVTYDLDV